MSEKQANALLSETKDICESFENENTHENLIPILQSIQNKFGYLVPERLMEVSRITKIPASKIYGVATFYEQFYLEPRGKHIVKCCRGTACHVRGGSVLIDVIKNELGIEEGQTTDDLEFTFETVACLGTCALAPVIVVDDVYYGKMDSKKIGKLIKDIREGKQESA